MSESIKSNLGLLATLSLAIAPLLGVSLALIALMSAGSV